MHEQSLEILKIVREAIDKIIVLLETEPTPVAENLTIIEEAVKESEKGWRKIKLEEYIQKEWLKEICKDFTPSIEWAFGEKTDVDTGKKQDKAWWVLATEQEHKAIQNKLMNTELWTENRERIGEIIKQQQKGQKS